MTGLLSRIAKGQPIEEPVALVVAHPDDEVIGLGSRLSRFRALTIVHLTDGAPRDGNDAKRAGFTGSRAYAAAREEELRAALDLLGVRARRIRCGCPDQEVVHHLSDLADRLRSDLAGMAAVFTHPYEHGHPDHDSAALAVAIAVPHLPRFEMAFYHRGPDGARFGRFWPGPVGEVTLPLSPDEQARKADAIRCFATQAETLAQFDLSTERLRPAPAYDFWQPAPPAAALYESWGFAENSADWRRHARRMLERACAA